MATSADPFFPTNEVICAAADAVCVICFHSLDEPVLWSAYHTKDMRRHCLLFASREVAFEENWHG